ncbi:hypothetical protein vseg_013142 [Gypsophila vaccaria]
MNLYGYNPEMYPTFQTDQQPDNNVNPYTFLNDNNNNNNNVFSDIHHNHEQIFNNGPPVEPTDVPDIPDTCFNYITTLLRDNDSDDRPGVTLHDYMTAQISYNKSLDAALLADLPNITSNHCLDDYLNMFACPINNGFNNYNHYDNNNNNNNNVDVSFNVNGVADVDDFVNNDDIIENMIADNFVSVGNEGVFCPDIVGLGDGGGYDVDGQQIEEQCFGFSGNENWDFDELVMGGVAGLGDVGDVNVFSDTILGGTEVPQMGVLGPSFVGGQGGAVQGEVRCNDTTRTSEKTRGRKHSEGEDGEGGGGSGGGGDDDGRIVKQSVVSDDWCDQIEKYGDVLLCPEGRNKPGALCGKSKSLNTEDQKGGGASKVSRKRGGKGQVTDLRALLTRCAQCVARVDLTGAYEMLKQIREHSSPYGDFLQRVAHYLANGMEARLEGKGSELTRANEHISSCEVLKANRVFVGSVPYKIMSYYTTNKTIASLAMESSSIHIIDFGIYYGLQWPCIIQNLSKRPNGPPKIRITGIDFPQRGFRPAERVEETGKCLAMYCEKYNVPFEYNGIAQQWETIKVEDLKIEPNEPLVVNCLYRSHNLFDESVDDNSPRDAFLRLVRKIKPDIFMHGIVNSTANVPFFLNRFKEVMFHYSALFDVFESTMSREDSERLLLESKLYGNQALNVIACEGVERVERPETYKQWVVRTQRAGFEQVPLDRDLVRRARAMVKRSFREEFSYDEDCHWVVQGWKGRILYAISCWKPV